METIYQRPRDYDLEHEGDNEDVGFYVRLVRALRPRRVLELAAGSGRVTLPLAVEAPPEVEAIVGVEIADGMRAEAERKLAGIDAPARDRVRFVQGDLRTWRGEAPFDLVIAPCSSLAHLLTLDDQLQAWRNVRENLAPGGRFVADLVMPAIGVYAESMQRPPRTTLEIDIDARDPDTGERLLRYKTTRYLPHLQRAEIRFLYDKLPAGDSVGHRYISDFDAHVYYPRELDLLFLHTGFEVEARYGDYRGRPPRATSEQLIVVGRRAG